MCCFHGWRLLSCADARSYFVSSYSWQQREREEKKMKVTVALLWWCQAWRNGVAGTEEEVDDGAVTVDIIRDGCSMVRVREEEKLELSGYFSEWRIEDMSSFNWLF